MRNILAVLVIAVLCSACADAYLIPSDERVEALVVANNLEPVDTIVALHPIRLVYVNDSYGLITARNDQYLVQFRRRCRGLQAHSRVHLQAKGNKGSLTIRAPFDLVNGCAVDHFFQLEDEAEMKLQELREG